LAASQSALDIDIQPVPLQLFMPLQLFFADLHSDVPLQEFTPVQCTFAASAATDTVAIPEVNSIAAAAAIAVLDSLVICMIESSVVIKRSDIAAPYKDPANARIITQLSKLMPNSWAESMCHMSVANRETSPRPVGGRACRAKLL
jgi:hypothetical protein